MSAQLGEQTLLSAIPARGADRAVSALACSDSSFILDRPVYLGRGTDRPVYSRRGFMTDTRAYLVPGADHPITLERVPFPVSSSKAAQS